MWKLLLLKSEMKGSSRSLIEPMHDFKTKIIPCVVLFVVFSVPEVAFETPNRNCHAYIMLFLGNYAQHWVKISLAVVVVVVVVAFSQAVTVSSVITFISP